MAQLDFYRYGEDAITSNCTATVKGKKSSVVGNVTYVCWLDCGGDPPATDSCPDEEDCCIETVNGTVTQDNTPPPGIDWWPETWAIAKYFIDKVDISKPFTTGSIDVAVNSTIGPLYVDGDLDLYTSIDGASASLAGVIYVTGDLTMGGAHPFTLNLSDQVIFVENKNAIFGELPINKADAEVLIEGGAKSGCTLTGSGTIFAIGDIWFQPNMSTSPQDFTFIMSLEGWVHIQPNGDFYGSIAGQDVDLWPNLYIERTDSLDLWDTFPDTDVSIIKILTYDIIDQ